jgi:putative addiction module component
MSAMSIAFEELEKHARALSTEEKAALARILIEDLDTAVDHDTDRQWLEEAQRRYDAFLSGDLATRPGEEVMQRARDRLGAKDAR